MTEEVEDIGYSFVGALVTTAVFGPAAGMSFWGSVAATTALNYGLNEVGEALAPSPPSFELQRQRSDITTVSPISQHKIIYGRTITGGTLAYSQLSSFNSDYLNMVVALAPHEIEGIQKIYLNSDEAVTLELDDEVMSVSVQEHYSDSQSSNVSKTGTVVAGGQIQYSGYMAGFCTVTLVVGGTTVFTHTGGGVVHFETYQNTSGSDQSYTLTYTASGTGRFYMQLLNCNFQVAEKYKDLIHFYPVNGNPSSPDWFEFLGRDVSNETTAGYQYSSSEGEWDDSHEMKGVAHLWARIKYDVDVWQGRAPNIACVVKGKKLFDPRDNTTSWSDNPSLVLRDYLTNSEYGCGVSASNEINDDSFESAANLCEETLFGQNLFHGEVAEADDGSGKMMFIPNEGTYADDHSLPFHIGDTVDIKGIAATHPLYNQSFTVLKIDQNGRKFYFDHTYTSGDETTSDNVYWSYDIRRYSCHGLVDTAKSKKENINQILTTCAGRLTYSNGTFNLLGGEYRSPSYTITEDDIVGGIAISTRPPANALFNSIKGFYFERNTDYVARDYRPYELASAISDDGRTSYIDLPLRFTTNPKQAEELARIAINRARLFNTVRLSCNMSALRYQVGDTVQLTYERASISYKIYEIIDYKINISETVTIDLVLQEIASSLYPV